MFYYISKIFVGAVLSIKYCVKKEKKMVTLAWILKKQKLRYA